jgi:hypothetical protein
MPRDPVSIFGALLAGCISDVYLKQEKKVLAEEAVFLIIGALSSVATTYALAVTRVLL